MEQILNVYIDAELHKQLKQKSIKEGKSMKEIVNELIKDYLSV